MNIAQINGLTPDLSYSAEIAQEMAPLYEKVKSVIPPMEWPVFAPLIRAINQLKKERHAIILAHNYQTPEIFHGVADVVGDSLQLAREAARADADIIVQCGVHFMAETAKLLNPEKTVLIPDTRAGCSLAESITPADIRTLRRQYPGVPVVTYINTSAAVKAECDICCTSSNAVKIVESLDTERVILVPDEFIAQNVNAQTDVDVIAFSGRCEVHERFTAQELRDYRGGHDGLKIIAHPECPPEVLDEADFAGSTAGMIKWVHDHQPQKVMMVTECSMSDNVAVENPNVEFIRPCNLCPHMKKITLQNILNALLYNRHEVHIDPAIAAPARRAVERMIDLGR